jgi:hypothetical protein
MIPIIIGGTELHDIFKNNHIAIQMRESLMEEFDKIIFNDADGSDKDMSGYYHTGFRELGENISWYSPMFWSSSNDWSTIITYDDINEDIRYSVIVHDDDPDHIHATIFYGKAYREPGPGDAKEIKLIGNQYNMSFFLDYDIDSGVKSSSLNKFLNIMKKFTTLKAFL